MFCPWIFKLKYLLDFVLFGPALQCTSTGNIFRKFILRHGKEQEKIRLIAFATCITNESTLNIEMSGVQ